MHGFAAKHRLKLKFLLACYYVGGFLNCSPHLVPIDFSNYCYFYSGYAAAAVSSHFECRNEHNLDRYHDLT